MKYGYFHIKGDVKIEKELKMVVTKPIILKHIDLDTATKIMQRATSYNITTDINGTNSDGYRQVLIQFSISELIGVIEHHMKSMRSDYKAKNKKLVKTLKDINTKLKEQEDEK